jgi:importin-4
MVVSQTLQEIAETIKVVGPASLAFEQNLSGQPVVPGKDVLKNMLVCILKGEHLCQALDDDEEYSQVDEDLAELDAVVMSVAADVVGAMAAALGEGFATDVAPILPLIAKHYQKNKPVSDRNMAIGALAEIVEGLEGGVTPFTNDLLTLFANALNDEDDEVRSNGAFAVGVLVANSHCDLTKFYGDMLKLLQPLFNFDNKTNAVDNACGAVCRMILKNPQSVPIEAVMPTVLAKLPLKRDYEENTPVYRCILFLLENQNAFMVSQIPRILPIFAQVLAPPMAQVNDVVRDSITKFLESLKALHGDQFNQLLQGLQADQQAVLSNLR